MKNGTMFAKWMNSWEKGNHLQTNELEELVGWLDLYIDFNLGVKMYPLAQYYMTQKYSIQNAINNRNGVFNGWRCLE